MTDTTTYSALDSSPYAGEDNLKINNMIQTIEELKTKRPDLVEDFSNMTKDELINQCFAECLDAMNMEERVALFMAECTDNMSKTNYTIESLQTLINQKKESDYDEIKREVIEEVIGVIMEDFGVMDTSPIIEQIKKLT